MDWVEQGHEYKAEEDAVQPGVSQCSVKGGIKVVVR